MCIPDKRFCCFEVSLDVMSRQKYVFSHAVTQIHKIYSTDNNHVSFNILFVRFVY